MVSGNVAGPKGQTPDFNTLSEAEQRAVAERLLRISESGWKPFWCPITTCDGMPHPLLDTSGAVTYVSDSTVSGPNGEPVSDPDEDGQRWLLDPTWAHNHARVDQRLPPWSLPWTLLVLSGRGTGKTTTGVEFVTLCARRGIDGAIVGRRGTELENTHVKTLIERAHPEFMPEYLASKDLVRWPNGATTYLFSAERPENIRSVNLGYVWFDEAAWMDEIEKAWTNAKLATRVKDATNPIHFLITSTPTPTPWVIKMEEDPHNEVRRVSTYANRANLSGDFLADLEREYEGTRMGRQEIHGEVLRDVEGALWNDSMFRNHRAKDGAEFAAILESMDNRVLAIDPAGTANKRSDDTGIIGIGVQHTDDAGEPLAASLVSVLGDATIKGSPNEWAERAYSAARLLRVTKIIAEKNFGGDMVKQVLSDYAKLNPDTTCDENGEPFVIEVVHAVQSKETRAEATVARYEQGRVTHISSPTAYGDLSTLEKEQTLWVPKSRGGRSPSPNRIDALVWAMRAVEIKAKYAASQAGQNLVREVLKTRKSVPTTPFSGLGSNTPLLPAPIVWEGEKPPPATRYPVKLPKIQRR